MSARRPPFHVGFSFAQSLAETAIATVSPLSRHMRSMSLDHAPSEDSSAARTSWRSSRATSGSSPGEYAGMSLD